MDRSAVNRKSFQVPEDKRRLEMDANKPLGLQAIYAD